MSELPEDAARYLAAVSKRAKKRRVSKKQSDADLAALVESYAAAKDAGIPLSAIAEAAQVTREAVKKSLERRKG